MNWGSYVGLRFRPRGRDRCGVDCWGLVRLVYAEQFGIDLPEHGESHPRDLLAAADAMEADRAMLWRPCAPRAGAVALFSAPTTEPGLNGRPVHVGVFVDASRVLHVEHRTAAVVMRLSHPLIAHRFLGAYEYVG